MGTKEKVGWQLSGLFAGMVVSSLIVFASFGAALFFSDSATHAAGEDQAIASR